MGKTKKKNRAVIFAGGIGTRMWPLSRKSTPKQFEKIIGSKSTLQLTVDRIKPVFGNKNIYISTGRKYIGIVKKQLPQIPEINIIGEPEMRDVGPAVGYLMSILTREDPLGPVVILWSDHLMREVKTFQQILTLGCKYIAKHPDLFLLIGQKPRFPSQNLGWIEYGKKIDRMDDLEFHEFISWHYRPKLERAQEYFISGKHAWNPGYFIFTPKQVLEEYKSHAPKLYKGIQEITKSINKPDHEEVLAKIYPTFEKISFDNAIMEKIFPKQAVVVSADLGWSDVGAWEALKEVLQKRDKENVTKGNVVLRNCKDSLVYSYTPQLVTAIDIDKMVIVVTEDVILICPQDSIPEIKKQLKEFEGTKLEKYS